MLVDQLSPDQKHIVETEGASTDNETVKKIYEDGTVFDKNRKIWKPPGDSEERQVFEQLKEVLRTDPEANDAIVLQEMHLGQKSAGVAFQINELEHDYMILFPRRKCFCPFEVKSTLVTSNHHKAAVQLQKAQSMLQNFWWDSIESLDTPNTTVFKESNRSRFSENPIDSRVQPGVSSLG